MQVLTNVGLLQPNTYVVDSIQHVRESLIYEEKFQQDSNKIEGVPVKIEFDHWCTCYLSILYGAGSEKAWDYGVSWGSRLQHL